jgi:hypothetical protein
MGARKKFGLIIGTCMVFVLSTGCKDSGTDPDPNGPESTFPDILALTNPWGGETFYIGDTVRVTWKADTSPSTQLSGLKICLSADGGADYHTTKPLNVNEGQIDPAGSYRWIIGSEAYAEIAALLPSEECRILVVDYQKSEIYSESGIFKVKRR